MARSLARGLSREFALRTSLRTTALTFCVAQKLRDTGQFPVATKSAVSNMGTPSENNGSQRRSYVILDTFRGLAATYVLIFHARGLLGSTHPLIVGVFQWGVQAVLFFFVLSGFCIHLSQSRALAQDREAKLDVRGFAWRRFRRIYPPFVAALILTSIVDYVGVRLNAPYYQQLRITIGQTTRSPHWDPVTLAGNLFCLQPGVPTYGTNGPLWSLSYEAFFYLLYPVYFLLSRRFGPTRTLGAVLVFSGLGLSIRYLAGPQWVVPFGFLSYWGMWAFGATLADIAAGRLRLPTGGLTGLLGAVLLTLSALGLNPIKSATITNYEWAAGFALIAWWAVLSSDRFAALVRRLLKAMAFSARPSYSLYLGHVPVVTLLYALVARGAFASVPPEARFAVAVALGIASGLTLYLLVERRFLTSRNRSADARPVIADAAPVQLGTS